jgi:hypothetical protein
LSDISEWVIAAKRRKRRKKQSDRRFVVYLFASFAPLCG